MFKLLYASLKYFSLGLVIGLLTAPRSGRESWRMLRDQASTVSKGMFNGGKTGTTSTGF
ncbi:MAG: YtxH domain-containing protein [Chloroflexota bacterium]